MRLGPARAAPLQRARFCGPARALRRTRFRSLARHRNGPLARELRARSGERARQVCYGPSELLQVLRLQHGSMAEDLASDIYLKKSKGSSSRLHCSFMKFQGDSKLIVQSGLVSYGSMRCFLSGPNQRTATASNFEDLEAAESIKHAYQLPDPGTEIRAVRINGAPDNSATAACASAQNQTRFARGCCLTIGATPVITDPEIHLLRTQTHCKCTTTPPVPWAPI